MVDVGNKLVDAIIADGKSKGRADGIEIECNGKLSGGFIVTDFDLCIIFSNLVSNAIEACRKLEHSERYISITLKREGNTAKIIFANPVEWDVDIENFGEYTTKKDKLNHGFGINNVRKTVEKYNGQMTVGVEEGEFKTIISIANSYT